LEMARRYGTPEQIAENEDRYKDDLPTSAEEKQAVQTILKESRARAPEKSTERWGLLGYLGVSNWLTALDDQVRSPFLPYGFSGIMYGAALVFFAYLGFDSISTHAEEAVRPQRDVPIGILSSLFLCTLLYIGVAAVITGMVPYPDIDPDASVATAFSE